MVRSPAPPPGAKALARRVRDLREKKGWSQETLAEKADLHRTYLAGIETSRRNPTLRILAALAEALEVDLAALFEEPSLPQRVEK